ncbi:MAG: hypothetical protein GY791_19620, partial [Alphaproteobacteria bacterium]|nr:hypothetical protein [Alphaproteobacteria bacterium]
MAARIDDAKLANLSVIPSKISSARPAASLKTTLLVGAATVAVAAQLPVDEARAQDKWGPWIAPGGQFGSAQEGNLDIFVPLAQDATSMWFLNANGFANTDDEEQGSIGLGYRTMLNPQWILGVNGFF